MGALIAFLIHLLVLCLVFGLLYWVAMMIVGLLPPPVAQPARVVLCILLALIALSFLLGEVGFGWDPAWSYRHSRF
jgi:hypothetical protein